MKDSRGQAIRSGPSATRRVVRRHRAHGRDLHPRRSSQPSGRRPHLLRTTVQVHHPHRAGGHGEVCRWRVARGHDLLGPGNRAAAGQRQAQHPATRRIPQRQQVERRPRRARPARTYRGCPRPATTSRPRPGSRRKTCHSPLSPFCTRSITHLAIGEADRKCSAICSSAKGPARSRRSVPVTRSRNHTCCRKPAGSAGQGVPDPVVVVTPGHRPAYHVHVRDRLVHDLPARQRRRRAVSRPRCRARTARRRPGSRPGTARTSRWSSRPTGRDLQRSSTTLSVPHHRGRSKRPERALPGCLLLQREEGSPPGQSSGTPFSRTCSNCSTRARSAVRQPTSPK